MAPLNPNSMDTTVDWSFDGVWHAGGCSAPSFLSIQIFSNPCSGGEDMRSSKKSCAKRGLSLPSISFPHS